MNPTVEATNVAVYVLARVVTVLCEYGVPSDALVEDGRTLTERNEDVHFIVVG